MFYKPINKTHTYKGVITLVNNSLYDFIKDNHIVECMNIKQYYNILYHKTKKGNIYYERNRNSKGCYNFSG